MFKKLFISFFAFALAFLPIAPAIAVDTLWGYYASQGEPLPSVEERAITAATVGLFEYSGTADQNTELLYRLENPPPALFPQEEGVFGFSAVTGYQKTLRASMDSTQSYIPASSLLLSDGTTIDIDDLDGEVYLTLEPGKPRQEIVRCTGITTSTANFTSCTRGLAFKGTSVTSVAANRFSHNAGATIVISNVHYTFKNLIDGSTSNSQSIAGVISFASSTSFAVIPTIPTTTPTLDEQVASKAYIDGIAISGGANANTSTKGITKLSVDPVSLTNPIAVGDNDTRVSPVSLATVTAGQVEALAGTSGTPSTANKYVTNNDTTSTPTVDAVVRAQANSKIADGWVGATTAGDTVYSDGTDLQRLAIGTSDQVLKSTGTAPTWSSNYSKKIDVTQSTLSFTNNNTEQTIYSTTIPANSLSTNNLIKMKVYMTVIGGNGSSQQVTFNLKYGSTTIATHVTTAQTLPSSKSFQGFIEGIVMGNSSTSSQKGILFIDLLGQQFFPSGTVSTPVLRAVSSGTASEDSTADKTLSLTIQIPDATNQFTSISGYVELLR